MGAAQYPKHNSSTFFPPDLLPSIIRESRLSLKLGVRAFARRLRCSPGTIVAIESGRGVPRPGLVRRMAAEIGMPPEELLKASAELRAIRKSGAILAGMPWSTAGCLRDLPLIIEALTALRLIAQRHGRTIDESIAIMNHLGSTNRGFVQLLKRAELALHTLKPPNVTRQPASDSPEISRS